MLKPLSFFIISVLLISCHTSGGYYGLSKKDYLFVKKESIRGKLDFERELDDSIEHRYDGKKYSAREMALLMWGKAVRRIGMRSSWQAIEFYEHIHKYRLSQEERKILKTGFDLK